MRHIKTMKTKALDRPTVRLVTHVTQADMTSLEKAAKLEGRTLDTFVASQLRNRSRSIIRKHKGIHLNETQSKRFAEALLTPPRKPNMAMKKAVKNYSNSVTEH